MAESIPWTKTFPGLVCKLAAATDFILAAPYRGTLDSFTISQEGGVVEGFSVDLFNTKAVMNGVAVGDLEHYRIFPTKAAVTPYKVVADYTNKWIYNNEDGSPALGQRKLYLRITPVVGGGADKTFQVTITVQPPLLQ